MTETTETAIGKPDDATSLPAITPADLQALRERLEASSPGQWVGYTVNGEWLVRHDEDGLQANVILRTHSGRTQAEADATFVAAAHNTLAQVLATIEQLQARVAELEAKPERGAAGSQRGR